MCSNDAISALSQLTEGGAPARQAMGKMMRGDTSPIDGAFNEIKQIFDPAYMKQIKPMTQGDAMSMGMDINPMTGGVVSGNMYKMLEKANPSTVPKIPVSKVFKNDIGVIPDDLTKTF